MAASIQISSITNNSARARITGLDTNYSRDDRTVKYFLDDNVFQFATTDIRAGVSSSPYVTVPDLDSDTRYTIEATIQYSDGLGNWKYIYLDETFRTEVGRPGYFYWINSRTDLIEIPAGVNVSTYITANKWRELQSLVEDIRNYKGYGSYGFSRVYSGDTILASDYNDIVRAIKEIRGYGTYLSTVSKGDIISRSVMHALQEELNAIE